MKKILTGLFIALSTFFVNGQTLNTTQEQSPVFFAQCMLNLQTEQELTAVETHLKAIPYVNVVRVDIHTKRLFLITKNLSSFSSNEFNSWMVGYLEKVSCLQIGLHGVDAINPYPFTNCSGN